MQYGLRHRGCFRRCGDIRPSPPGGGLPACPSAALALVLAVAVLGFPGCKSAPAPPTEQAHYPTLPLADVPDFMRGTLQERIRFTNIDSMPVYGYTLVVNLHGTGDCTAPTWVRQYIAKQIALHGFGSVQLHRYKEMTADEILSDNRVAIVVVEGLVPVGARAGQRFDVTVRALPRSHTSSLAHGQLYRTQLSAHALDDPTAVAATPLAVVTGGDVFVNPAYALGQADAQGAAARASLRVGTVLDAGVVRNDRPIYMQIRQPQISTARRIEELIQRRWHGSSPADPGADRSKVVAAAQDLGLVFLYVPQDYNGDWQHFIGVVSHLYVNDAPQFIIAKAKGLIAEARKPGARLADISLCWEAMGEEALPIFAPLISDPDPNVAFAAARAAAFIGDSPARDALRQIAADSSNRYQLDAVRALGALPPTPETFYLLRTLLESDKAAVRIEAYRVLAAAGEGIFAQRIADNFFLDVIPHGSPMVYATTSGVPRLALFGPNLRLQTPITFTAMDSRLSISSSDGTDKLTIFYRSPHQRRPTDVQTRNDLAEILARLGGGGPDRARSFDFSFNDVVAVAQQLVDSQRVYSAGFDGRQVAAVFELQHPRLEADPWTSVPRDNLAGRPQGTPQPSPARFNPAPTTAPAPDPSASDQQRTLGAGGS